VEEHCARDLEFLSDELPQKVVPEGFFLRHENGSFDWQPKAAELTQRPAFWETMQRCLSKITESNRQYLFDAGDGGHPEQRNLRPFFHQGKQRLGHAYRAQMAVREGLGMSWFAPDDSRKL